MFPILALVFMAHAADDPLVSLSETGWPVFMDQELSDPKTVWETHRRAEILSQFEDLVYGKAPEVGFQLAIELLEENVQEPLNARRLRLATHVTTPLGQLTIHTTLFLPLQGGKASPVFLGMHLFDSSKKIPVIGQPWIDPGEQFPDLAKKDSVTVLKMILKRGYGFATIDANDVDPDEDDGFENGIHALFHDGQNLPHQDNDWGTLAAWAWGLGRSLDALETLDAVDAKRVIVIGHSRMGKAALWAGAQDERFAMVISNNSGCGGAAISRRKKGETVAHINRNFPHWFCRSFHAYGDREDQLPVDQHMLVALSAPRPVYIASAVQDNWSDPFGEYLSGYYASEVYQYYGMEGLRKDMHPEINKSIGDRVGYHLRTGRHDITTFDWLKYLDFADRHLRP
jgi:hypothetical protein